ncbi:hypothetical protein D9M71_661930 [compost metagenome]
MDAQRLGQQGTGQGKQQHPQQPCAFASGGDLLACEPRPHHPKHHTDENRHAGKTETRRAPTSGLGGGNDERQHAPRSCIAQRRTGNRRLPQRAMGHAAIGKNAQQHREGSDAHRDTDEQRKRSEAHTCRAMFRIQPDRQQHTTQEWHRNACVADRNRKTPASS